MLRLILVRYPGYLTKNGLWSLRASIPRPSPREAYVQAYKRDDLPTDLNDLSGVPTTYFTVEIFKSSIFMDFL